MNYRRIPYINVAPFAILPSQLFSQNSFSKKKCVFCHSTILMVTKCYQNDMQIMKSNIRSLEIFFSNEFPRIL